MTKYLELKRVGRIKNGFIKLRVSKQAFRLKEFSPYGGNFFYAHGICLASVSNPSSQLRYSTLFVRGYNALRDNDVIIIPEHWFNRIDKLIDKYNEKMDIVIKKGTHRKVERKYVRKDKTGNSAA